MNKQAELLPCPFCGSKSIDVLEVVGEAWCLCLDCKASSGAGSVDRAMAIEIWNTRSNSERDKAIARAAFLAGLNAGTSSVRGSYYTGADSADDYLQSEEFKELVK